MVRISWTAFTRSSTSVLAIRVCATASLAARVASPTARVIVPTLSFRWPTESEMPCIESAAVVDDAPTVSAPLAATSAEPAIALAWLVRRSAAPVSRLVMSSIRWPNDSASAWRFSWLISWRRVCACSSASRSLSVIVLWNASMACANVLISCREAAYGTVSPRTPARS